MASKGSNKGQKAQYAKYKATDMWLKNRIRKLVKHVLKFPSDTIAATALDAAERGQMRYRRS